MSKTRVKQDRRILILAPTGRDSQLTAQVFRDYSLKAEVCSGAEQLCEQLKVGAGLLFSREA